MCGEFDIAPFDDYFRRSDLWPQTVVEDTLSLETCVAAPREVLRFDFGPDAAPVEARSVEHSFAAERDVTGVNGVVFWFRLFLTPTIRCTRAPRGHSSLARRPR